MDGEEAAAEPLPGIPKNSVFLTLRVLHSSAKYVILWGAPFFAGSSYLRLLLTPLYLSKYNSVQSIDGGTILENIRANWKLNCFRILIFLLILLMIATRLCGLTYNMSLHPDEGVFYKSAGSLANSILHPGTAFSEAKEYPEGAYVFQMPFHILKEFVYQLTGIPQNDQVWGRSSSVFYFVLAVTVGIKIMVDYMGKSKVAALIYAVTMCFSLFFIEHSRYGVGDMISLFLIMSIIFLTAKALTSQASNIYFLAACIACGAMGAVKYPQIVFISIPIAAYTAQSSRNTAKKIMISFLLISVSVGSFLIFSPKAAQDFSYIFRVVEREANAYVLEGTTFEDGGLLNHIAGVILYNLLYSDFPFSFMFLAVFFARSLVKPLGISAENDCSHAVDYLFLRIIPIVSISFFTYNLFAKLLIFRTYTPYFGICVLYCSQAAAEFFHNGKWQRFIVLSLSILMVIRGGYLIAVTTSGDTKKEQFSAQIADAVGDNWNKTVLMPPYNMAANFPSATDEVFCLQNQSTDVERIRLLPYIESNNGFEIQPGELIITGSYEFGVAGSYVFTAESSSTYPQDEAWNTFKEMNSAYYKGQSYPSCFYYLFGGWIRGGTLSTSLIPCNYIYYRNE